MPRNQSKETALIMSIQRITLLSSFVHLVVSNGPAYGLCACQCVDGQMRAVCTSTIEHRPLCPPSVCPLPPPTISPANPRSSSPTNPRGCVQQQVMNPDNKRYEWR